MMAADAIRCRRYKGGGDIELVDDFILLVDTSQGQPNRTTTLAWYGPFNITIDWGDGTVEVFTKAVAGNEKFSHTYSADGQYEIHVNGSAFSTGFGTSTERDKWFKCLAVGTVTDDFANAFKDARNLISVPDRIPAGAKSMDNMFFQALALEAGLVNWDVSQVTNMGAMLSFTYNFDQDLSGWCVTNIPSEPPSFAIGSALQPQHYPIWGTCP